MTDGELELQNAIYDVLATWPDEGVAPTLAQVGEQSSVSIAKQNLLPLGVSMQVWIERRLPDDLECINGDEVNQMFVGVKPLDPDSVQRGVEKILADRDLKGPREERGLPLAKRQRPMPLAGAKSDVPCRYFASATGCSRGNACFYKHS